MKSIPYERPPGDVVPRTSLLASIIRSPLSSAPGLCSYGARTPATLPVFPTLIRTSPGGHAKASSCHMAARPIGSISSSQEPMTEPWWSTSPKVDRVLPTRSSFPPPLPEPGPDETVGRAALFSSPDVGVLRDGVRLQPEEHTTRRHAAWDSRPGAPMVR